MGDEPTTFQNIYIPIGRSNQSAMEEKSWVREFIFWVIRHAENVSLFNSSNAIRPKSFQTAQFL